MLRDTAGFSFTGLVWSPDGTRLAYTDNGVIHVLDLASGTDQRLVEGSWPAWSTLGAASVAVYTSGEFLGEGSRTVLRAIEQGTSRIAFVSSDGSAPSSVDWFG